MTGHKPDGTYGAQGMTGGEAIARQLDQLAHHGAATTFRAKVVFLTNSAAGQHAMMAAGIDLAKKSTRNTVLGWLSEPDASTTPKYRRAVDRAYEARRRETMGRELGRRLGKARGGRGAQIEIHPLNQSGVAGKHRRDLGIRKMTVRPQQWQQITDAWTRGDIEDMDVIYEGAIEDGIGSDWTAFAWVSSIGFGA